MYKNLEKQKANNYAILQLKASYTFLGCILAVICFAYLQTNWDHTRVFTYNIQGILYPFKYFFKNMILSDGITFNFQAKPVYLTSSLLLAVTSLQVSHVDYLYHKLQESRNQSFNSFQGSAHNKNK